MSYNTHVIPLVPKQFTRVHFTHDSGWMMMCTAVRTVWNSHVPIAVVLTVRYATAENVKKCICMSNVSEIVAPGGGGMDHLGPDPSISRLDRGVGSGSGPHASWAGASFSPPLKRYEGVCACVSAFTMF